MFLYCVCDVFYLTFTNIITRMKSIILPHVQVSNNTTYNAYVLFALSLFFTFFVNTSKCTCYQLNINFNNCRRSTEFHLLHCHNKSIFHPSYNSLSHLLYLCPSGYSDNVVVGSRTKCGEDNMTLGHNV